MEMFETNGDIIIRQKYGDVLDKLRDDQMGKKDGAIIRYGDFQRNEEIIRWRKMKMFESNGDLIIRQKYGDVLDKLRDDQM